jgi:phosphoenolpyruvate-protein kinase (PTS system EI component)
VGICGEHGGDPESIAFCHKLGLNYVSCSPFRVPVARLAANTALNKFHTDLIYHTQKIYHPCLYKPGVVFL